jgi:hypothetical protein
MAVSFLQTSSGGTGARIGLKGRFTNGVFGYLLDIKSVSCYLLSKKRQKKKKRKRATHRHI